MTITSIRFTFSSGPARKKPKVGDRRTTKKHGEQIRVRKLARDHLGRAIGYDCTGGRQNYEWVKLADLDRGDRHLLTSEERARLFPAE